MTLVIAVCGASPALTERALAKFLSARREEIKRLGSLEQREQKTVGEALLRLAAKKRGQNEVTLARGEKGKPYFAELPAFCFNLSHSGAIVAAVFSCYPVGIDVERVAGRNFQTVAARCFSPAEQKKIARSEAPLREFYRLWTRRESIIKRRGEGVERVRSVKVSGERVLSFGLTGGKLSPFAESREAQYVLSVCLSQGEKPNLTVHVCTAEEVLAEFLR